MAAGAALIDASRTNTDTFDMLLAAAWSVHWAAAIAEAGLAEDWPVIPWHGRTGTTVILKNLRGLSASEAKSLTPKCFPTLGAHTPAADVAAISRLLESVPTNQTERLLYSARLALIWQFVTVVLHLILGSILWITGWASGAVLCAHADGIKCGMPPQLNSFVRILRFWLCANVIPWWIVFSRFARAKQSKCERLVPSCCTGFPSFLRHLCIAWPVRWGTRDRQWPPQCCPFNFDRDATLVCRPVIRNTGRRLTSREITRGLVRMAIVVAVAAPKLYIEGLILARCLLLFMSSVPPERPASSQQSSQPCQCRHHRSAAPPPPPPGPPCTVCRQVERT
ncbi:hypothetical protein JKP88DRAFT_254971 [Tribonema minus]|uniref:Uncharacterized protein n=1 Tax=Tribonema minus TaxID=303371 RepID=A0A835Z5L7_9STRA|nr:hypothetical protein JKP88DRAFT_254971 [Tribonema minus]